MLKRCHCAQEYFFACSGTTCGITSWAKASQLAGSVLGMKVCQSCNLAPGERAGAGSPRSTGTRERSILRASGGAGRRLLWLTEHPERSQVPPPVSTRWSGEQGRRRPPHAKQIAKSPTHGMIAELQQHLTTTMHIIYLKSTNKTSYYMYVIDLVSLLLVTTCTTYYP